MTKAILVRRWLIGGSIPPFAVLRRNDMYNWKINGVELPSPSKVYDEKINGTNIPKAWKINVRCGGEDNICEKLRDNDCKNCLGCANENNFFEITDYWEYISIRYFHRIDGVVIDSYSERIDKKTLKQII